MSDSDIVLVLISACLVLIVYSVIVIVLMIFHTKDSSIIVAMNPVVKPSPPGDSSIKKTTPPGTNLETKNTNKTSQEGNKTKMTTPVDVPIDDGDDGGDDDGGDTVNRTVTPSAGPAPQYPTRPGIKWIEKEAPSFMDDIGDLGRRMRSTCNNKKTHGIQMIEKSVKGGSKILQGNRVRLLFNLPFPTVDKVVKDSNSGKMYRELYTMSLDDAYQIVCKADLALDQLYKDFPDFICNRTNATPLNIMIIHNGTGDTTIGNGVSGMGNNDLCYLSPTICVGHEYLGFMSTIVHELTHGMDPTYRDTTWGQGFGESIARFSEYIYFPGAPQGYTCIERYYQMSSNVNLNKYSSESLRYENPNYAGYNPTFWIFFEARYGMDAYKKIMSTTMSSIVKTINFYQGVANFLKKDKNTFALEWLSDMMTLSFYKKDAFRQKSAERYLLKGGKGKATLLSDDLVWKESQHGELGGVRVDPGLSYSGTMTSRKLEAFAFATFDVAAICSKSIRVREGSRINVTITSIDTLRENDQETWAMVAVLGKENTIVSSATNTITFSLPLIGKCMLGVTHSKTSSFTNRNTAKGTAVAYNIVIKAT